MNREFSEIVVGATTIIIGLYVVAVLFGTMPATEFHQVDNETITIDVNNDTVVAESYGTDYYDNETVYNASGTVLTEGTDYDFFTENATIRWYNTASVNDGNDANVTYAFDAKPQMARKSVGTIGQSFTLGAVALIVLIASLVLALVGDFGSNGGRGGGRL